MKPPAIEGIGLPHPSDGTLSQAQHVFIEGNGLPQRWQQRSRFVVLETLFGLGNNFLATWQAWRQDPQRCTQLVFIAIEPNPLRAADMRRAHANSLANSPAAALAEQLMAAWPPLTSNIHRMSFEGGQVQLLLALGHVSAWLPELVAEVDAFYLDLDPVWQPRIFKALARLAAPGATLATRTSDSAVRSGLHTAGFELRKATPDITQATYAPTFTPRRAPSRVLRNPSASRHALIIGAGLAGCATACALAELGWSSTVFDRQAAPAQETSGNPGGLFHGIVNAQDGTHARFNRAAALQAQQAVQRALQQHAVAGAVQGLLRLDSGNPTDMHATLTRLGLPPDYVRAVSPAEASALSGMSLTQAAWFYPGGGWVQPHGLAQAWLTQAAGRTQFRANTSVAQLRKMGSHWQLLDAHHQLIEQAEVVVLANAGDALRLLGNPPWPLEPVRGQISLAQAGAVALPRIPIAGAGYLLPPIDGHAVFGATAQPGDMDASVRDTDHGANLAQLSRLVGRPIELPASTLSGRTGWRWVAPDRLPLIGAVPSAHTQGLERPLDQPRLVPRMEGLYVMTGLASRGITWSALGAQTLAALIAGAPVPLEASLLDAIDPARFISRAVRRAGVL